MINIISRALVSDEVSGPGKVAKNLVRGLELIRYPFVVNKRLDYCSRLWIHDDHDALKRLGRLPPSIKVVVGPNLFHRTCHIPADVDLSRAVYLQPSEWAKSFWITFGFDKCPVEVWATGIDTYEFRPQDSQKKHILIYFKQRFAAELAAVTELLDSKGLKYRIIRYPGYPQEEYKDLLADSRYVIWLGRQESQGIAFQEAMASGVPMLVWDVPNVGYCDMGGSPSVFTSEENSYTNTTSAPYFDERCGIKIMGAAELAAAVELMERNWRKFNPRQYVLENLSLEKKARDLLNIFNDSFHLKWEEETVWRPYRHGNWTAIPWRNRVKNRLKTIIKSVLRGMKRR